MDNAPPACDTEITKDPEDAMTALNRLTLPLALGLSLVGCDKQEPVDPQPPIVNPSATLRRMASCDELKDRVADVLIEQMSQSWGYRWDAPMEDGAEGAPTDDDASAGGDGGGDNGPTDYTGTNVQEEGVDELDLVKTDGEHIFVAQDRALHIVKSWPAAESAKVSSLDLPGWTNGLFQTGPDTLVVISSVSGSEVGIEDAWWGLVQASVVDISDRANPTVVRNELTEGWLASARMVDGKVWMVINQPMQLPDELWTAAYGAIENIPYPDWEAPETEWTAWRQAIRTAVTPVIEAQVAAASIDDLLPGARTGDSGALTALQSCEDIYAPEQLGQLSMLTVAELDPASAGLSATGVMADGWITYASATNLYVAQTSWYWWNWDGDMLTHIHKFAMGGDEPTYVGSGAIEGWLYGQFAMSEHEGNLRVVSTDFDWWFGTAEDVAVSVDEAPAEPAEDGDVATGGGGSDGSVGGGAPGDAGEEEPADPPEDVPADDPPDDTPVDETPTIEDLNANHVWVLQPADDGSLAVIGHVSGIAPGEQIRSARMMGDKGYMVTFRQTDPLFTLDLSDPTAPQVTGELVMTGFSAYLHPLGEDHLIGVGMNGTDTGQLTNLSIAVFDVSDMSNPTLAHRYDIDAGGENSWAWSEALWDHHAFTYGRDVLTIPAYTEHWDYETGIWSGFSGTMSFRVTADGIEELGRVDHTGLVAQSECLYDLWYGGGDIAVEGDKGDEVDIDVGAPDDGGADVSQPAEEGESDQVQEAPPDDAGDTGGMSEPGEPGEDPIEPGEYYSWCDQPWYGWANVRRSVYVEDNLYTISNYGIRVNDLNDPSQEIATVLFFPATEPAPE